MANNNQLKFTETAITAPNVEAELLGTLLVYSNNFQEALDLGAKAYLFSDSRLKTLFETMEKLNSEGQPTTFALVLDQANSTGKLNDIGGLDFLMNIQENCSLAPEFIETEIKKLNDFAYKRAVVGKQNEIIELVKQGKTPEEINKMLLEVANKTDQFYNNGAYTLDANESMLSYSKNGFANDLKVNREGKFMTCFPYFNEAVGGFMLPGMYVVGATSSLGKTTFVHQLADAAAEHKPVLYFSIEMSKQELLVKSINRLANNPRMLLKEDGAIPYVNSTSLKLNWNPEQTKETTPFTETQFNAITEGYNKYLDKYANNMFVTDCNFKCDLDMIISKVKRFCSTHEEKPLVVIDYLQIIPKPEGYRGTDMDWLNHCIMEIERMAKSNMITVILVSSLNRQSYGTKVSFESFKGTGAIEYSADCVIAMDLCEIEDVANEKDEATKKQRLLEAKGETPRRIAMTVLKNRNGRVGKETYFLYYPAQDTFQNVELRPEKPEKQSGLGFFNR